ncbi:MAG: hypothetical protein ACI4HZ_10280, partial [Ruminococcus sp.]
SMSIKEKTLYYPPYHLSVFDFVDRKCFRDWSCRGHFVDVKDFLESVDYNEIKASAKNGDIDAFMTLIELTYNLWMLAHKDLIDEKSGSKWQNNFYHLRDVMLDNLEKYNHTAYVEDDRVLIIEDKPEVTAVAEIVEQDLALDIIRYNHRSLQGEIELKKSILISLGSELEPKRKELQALNKQLSEDIFFMLNNINIRHNNRSKKDMSKYKEYVAKMSKTKLERWYDELYQMMLLAFLLLGNVDRTETIKELKGKIVGG